MKIIKPYQPLDKAEIERQATDLRIRTQAQRKRPLKRDFVAEAVADFLDLGVVWEKIPPDTEGTIAAMILPVQHEIIINKNIPALEGGFGQSTIAHEIGHWILHIDRNAVGQFVDRLDEVTEIEIEPFLCRSVTSTRGIEWQAQYFASCLLMPQFELEKAKVGRNLTRWPHLYAMADEFGVTISNLTNRLKGLGWIRLSESSKCIYLGEAAPKG
ncbi:MAG: ImmA/IrrE family metallo-endopeptidase [Cyanobacteriota bacterium]|nr:ImmA/IrrE family metallo-endopeptidase [Cyanobacteriota bacterium]